MAIRFSPVVQDALDHGNPVVALETAIITHSLPKDLNLQVAFEVEDAVRSAGVIPASIGVIDGDAVIGLSHDELAQLASDQQVRRVSIKDLAVAQTKGLTASTTLAATIHLAHRAGIKVCATTGLGGVHRLTSMDDLLQESSDLSALASHPVVLVASGVRPLLDLGATLERLETMSVPVLGYQTRRFPGYYVTETDYYCDWQVDTAEEIAKIAKARDELQLQQALLIANPIVEGEQLPDYDEKLAEAVEIAAEFDDADPDDTQILLISLEEATDGQAWEVNSRIYRQNALLASAIAKRLATTPQYTD